MTCHKNCKKCHDIAEEVFQLNTNCYQCCHHGMIMTSAESDKFGRSYIDIYHDYHKSNLDLDMKYIFPDNEDIISKVITKMADDLYYLYKDAKKKTALNNDVLYDLFLIKNYCLNENFLKNDMHFFDVSNEDFYVIEKYLTKLGIIYTPKKRAAKILLRVLIMHILEDKDILNEMSLKIEKNKDHPNSKDIIIKLYTKKYVKEIVKYFKNLG